MAVVITEQEAIHIQHVMRHLEDRFGSHGIDAIKRLFVALDDVGQGVVGGCLDKENQVSINTILTNPKLVKIISGMRYDGYESLNEIVAFGLVHIAMSGDKDKALECNWERDDCDGHTNEYPSMCDDCLIDFGFEWQHGEELYIIEHEDYSTEFDLPQLLWVKEVDECETIFTPVVGGGNLTNDGYIHTRFRV